MKREMHPSTPTPMADAVLAISSLRHAGTTSSCNDYVTHVILMAIVLHPTEVSKEDTKFKTPFRLIGRYRDGA